MKIKEIAEFFQNKQAINFIKWLNKDKRRLILMKKVLGILFKNQDKRLTFDQLLKETKLCRSSLSTVIRKLRLMNMISDYDTEKIIEKTRTRDDFEYTIDENEERFYYRYRYRFNSSNQTALLLSAIWSLNIINKKIK